MRRLIVWIAALFCVGCSQYIDSDSVPVYIGRVYTASINDEISRVYMDENLSFYIS